MENTITTGKRSGIDFINHEIQVVKKNNLNIWHLKKPDTYWESIKFINVDGIMSVTGDYGNWIFCREFHPSSDGGVSDSYWKEKLKNASTQEPNEFDVEGTIEDIKTLLAEEDLDEEEIEYLNECIDKAQEGQFDYEYFAHRENCGMFSDHEYVPHRMKTKPWLNAVFDGFDEICRRIKNNELKQ